jgi:hypothetical protein
MKAPRQPRMAFIGFIRIYGGVSLQPGGYFLCAAGKI